MVRPCFKMRQDQYDLFTVPRCLCGLTPASLLTSAAVHPPQSSGWHLELGLVFIPQHQQNGELGMEMTGPVLPRKSVTVLLSPQGWFLAHYPRLPLEKVWSACLLLPRVPFFECNSSTMVRGHGRKMESRLAWAT